MSINTHYCLSFPPDIAILNIIHFLQSIWTAHEVKHKTTQVANLWKCPLFVSFQRNTNILDGHTDFYEILRTLSRTETNGLTLVVLCF